MCILIIKDRINQLNAFLKNEMDNEKYRHFEERKALLSLECRELSLAVKEMEKYTLCGDVDGEKE